jgi:hypothetical protein
MFLDTRGFFGEQYDVTATVAQDGGVNLLKNIHEFAFGRRAVRTVSVRQSDSDTYSHT